MIEVALLKWLRKVKKRGSPLCFVLCHKYVTHIKLFFNGKHVSCKGLKSIRDY